MSKSKKYFSHYGILAATIIIKLHSFLCTINTMLSLYTSIIFKLLLEKELKTIQVDYPYGEILREKK